MRIGWQELDYGIRLLFKHPSFTVAAVLAMALGTATSTMIFSMVDAGYYQVNRLKMYSDG